MAELKQLLDDAEVAFGMRLTVIGHQGRLHAGHDSLIGDGHNSHQRLPACALGFGAECVAHCRWQVNHRLEARPAPLVTRCWKGLREIAVPIRWQGLHLGTLYAGTWRTQRLNQAGRSLGDAWQQAWRSLPVWDPTLEARWTSVLSTFADGFAQAISRAQERTAVGDRGAMLNTWFNLHYHLPVGLPDLAEHLGRSVSRAGAIVRETYGMPFALVLRRFRMDRAKHLLLTTVDPVAAIAQTVGYDDPAWFSRAFRQHSGHSPRAWRLREIKSHPY